MIKPRPYQIPNIDRMEQALRSRGAYADTSVTGSGKTVMSLLCAKRLGLKVVVVCPKAVEPDWREMARLVGVEAEVVNYAKLVRSPKGPEGLGQWRIKKARWSWNIDTSNVLIVWDEAHRLSPKALSSKILKATVEAKIPQVLMSATIADSPLKMRAVGFALGLCDFDWEQWQGWCLTVGCTYGDFHQLNFEAPEGLTEEEATAWTVGKLTEIRESAGILWGGVKQSELPDDFPASNVIVKLVPSTKSGAKIDSFYSKALEAREANAKLQVVADGAARQLAEWEKKDSMLELAKDAEASGSNVALFVQFTETGRYLADKLDCYLVDGDNNAEERAEAIAEFQANRSTFLVLLMSAGGTGINLQDLHGKPRVTVISPGASPLDLVQALGRTPRLGGLSSCTQYLVFQEASTVEHRIAKRVRARLANMSALTENDLSIMPDITTETKTKVAWIDGDMILHRCGHITKDLGIEDYKEAVDELISFCVDSADCTEFKMAMGAPPNQSGTFRHDLFPEYKANRKGLEKPPFFYEVYEWILKERNGFYAKGLEADDLLGMLGGEGVRCSGDKDFMTLPGTWFNFLNHVVIEVAPKEADYHFLKQTLTGDSTDNYKGIPRVGEVKACKILDEGGASWETVLKAYEEKELSAEYALTMGQMAYILRPNNFDGESVRMFDPIKDLVS